MASFNPVPEADFPIGTGSGESAYHLNLLRGSDAAIGGGTYTEITKVTSGGIG